MLCRGQKLSELTKDIIRVDWSLSVRIGIEDFYQDTEIGVLMLEEWC